MAFLAWDNDEHKFIDITIAYSVIYSNEKLRNCYRFGRVSIEYNTFLIKSDLRRKTNCYFVLKAINQVLITLQFYASGHGDLLQVVGDTTGVDKSTLSLAVHNADTILETITVLTHGELHYGILFSISETIQVVFTPLTNH